MREHKGHDVHNTAPGLPQIHHLCLSGGGGCSPLDAQEQHEIRAGRIHRGGAGLAGGQQAADVVLIDVDAVARIHALRIDRAIKLLEDGVAARRHEFVVESGRASRFTEWYMERDR